MIDADTVLSNSLSQHMMENITILSILHCIYNWEFGTVGLWALNGLHLKNE
jgi:hypothetical protein